MPIKLFLLENLYIYFSCFLYHPSPESSIHLVFHLLFIPRVKTHAGTRAFSVDVPTLWNSLPEHVMSSNSIVSFPSDHCWSTLHRTRTMNLPNPSTRCTTELDSFRGYWRYRSFVINIIIWTTYLHQEQFSLWFLSFVIFAILHTFITIFQIHVFIIISCDLTYHITISIYLLLEMSTVFI